MSCITSGFSLSLLSMLYSCVLICKVLSMAATSDQCILHKLLLLVCQTKWQNSFVCEQITHLLCACCRSCSLLRMEHGSSCGFDCVRWMA